VLISADEQAWPEDTRCLLADTEATDQLREARAAVAEGDHVTGDELAGDELAGDELRTKYGPPLSTARRPIAG
jgi:hypothetical protein